MIYFYDIRCNFQHYQIIYYNWIDNSRKSSIFLIGVDYIYEYILFFEFFLDDMLFNSLLVIFLPLPLLKNLFSNSRNSFYYFSFNCLWIFTLLIPYGLFKLISGLGFSSLSSPRIYFLFICSYSSILFAFLLIFL